MITRSIALIVFVNAISIGCASSAALPTSTICLQRFNGVDDRAVYRRLATGSRWQTVGHAAQSAPVDASYSLTFADGRIAARADRNSCSSAFSLSGTKLTLSSAMACTRAACPTMQFESVYTSLLTGEQTVAINGNTLVLSSERGSLNFVR